MGLLAQDRRLESGHLGSGVEPELGDQDPAQLMQGPQRVGLLPDAVLREREQLPPTLPQRRLLHQPAGLGERLGMLPGAQLRIDPQLLSIATQLLQPIAFQASGLPVVELDERRALPQLQCLPEAVRRPLRLPEVEQLPAPRDQALELVRVHLAGCRRQPVTVADGLDHVRAECLAYPHDRALQRLGPRGRRAVSPQRLGQLVAGDHVPESYGERGQDDPVPGGQSPLPAVDPQGAQHRYPHLLRVTLAALPVNAVITGPLPVAHHPGTGWGDNRGMTNHTTPMRGAVMTSSIAHPGHHYSTTNLALALAGAVLAVGAGYGVAALVLEDPVPALPTSPTEIDLRDYGSNPEGFTGTNREQRGLMHLR